MKTLVAAVVMMCYSGTCETHHVQIEKRACSFGTVQAKMMGMDAHLGVKCEPSSEAAR
jgi:hypothetical protein